MSKQSDALNINSFCIGCANALNSKELQQAAINLDVSHEFVELMNALQILSQAVEDNYLKETMELH